MSMIFSKDEFVEIISKFLNSIIFRLKHFYFYNSSVSFIFKLKFGSFWKRENKVLNFSFSNECFSSMGQCSNIKMN